MSTKGKIIIISGPSGVGKHTIITQIMGDQDLNLAYSISMTTRSPRAGEVHGVDYYFATPQEFNDHIQQDDFVEYATFCSNSYGTLKSELKRITDQGQNALLEIEVQGAIQVLERLKNENLLSIFIAPPSLAVLKQRLIERHTETDDQVVSRIKQAEYELSIQDKYQYVVVNDDLDQAINEIKSIIKGSIHG